MPTEWWRSDKRIKFENERRAFRKGFILGATFVFALLWIAFAVGVLIAFWSSP